MLHCCLLSLDQIPSLACTCRILATVLKGLNRVQNTNFNTTLNLTLMLIKIQQPLAQEHWLS